MTTKRITDEQTRELSISSLPTRPTAPKAFGGRGYTAADMKSAFDRLPLLIIARFNSLLEDITAKGAGSLAASVPTGISEGHCLWDLFLDLENGAAATYITVNGNSLAEKIAFFEERIRVLEEKLGVGEVTEQ